MSIDVAKALENVLVELSLEGITLDKQEFNILYFNIPKQHYMYGNHTGIYNSEDCAKLYVKKLIHKKYGLDFIKVRYRTYDINWTLQMKENEISVSRTRIDDVPKGLLDNSKNFYDMLIKEGITIVNVIISDDNRTMYLILEIPRDSYLYHLGTKVNSPETFAMYIKEQFYYLSNKKIASNVIIKYKVKDIYWSEDMRQRMIEELKSRK